MPKRSPYKKRELKALHEMLLKERESVRKMIISLGDRTFSSASSRRHGEERGYTLELAENASDNETKDTRFSVLAMQETHMAQAEEALARMNEGLYGICVACGATIGYERLMAKPFAVLCIGCRTNYERLRRIGAGGGSGYYY
ncbi:MAG: RNA polymerase-binding transcription factor DksA [candidate division BRC1 bacterium ADurb.BinA364]|nr:MAG: RNA polymerase-binding transcription factor DksA [candidate division BRC1 bacterium ADurb.BinA364]